MEAQIKRTNSDQLAREYIDRVLAINRRHGMGDQIPDETYDRAVQQAARALTLRRLTVLTQEAEEQPHNG